MINLAGTGVALVTPFQNGQVDYKDLEKLINHVIDGSVEYLVSLGTTGETPTLSAKEQIEVLEFTIKVNNKRVPLIAGFGGNNTAQIIKDIKSFHFKGVDAILSSSPNYNKPSQEGIFQHFMAIAEVSPCPIIIYNVPGRTASNIDASTTIRLAKASDKFIAIKEASGDLVQCMKIVQNKPEGFLLLSGDDILTLPMIACGAQGVISVIGNAMAQPFSDLVRFALNGDYPMAKRLHMELMEMMQLIFVEGNPVGIKGVLNLLGICSKEVRLPLVELTPDTFSKLKAELEKISVFEMN